MIIDLSQPLRAGMPQSTNHVAFRMTIERRYGDVVRDRGISSANELITLSGHVGTHVDALVHVSRGGLFHGGRPIATVQNEHGFSELGIETFAPYVGRAVLFDIAAVHGVKVLAPGYEVSVDDLRAAEKRGGTTADPGEVILIGTGSSRHVADKEKFSVRETPGPGPAAAGWLARRRPRAVGAETMAFEVAPAGSGRAPMPVHAIMLVDHGINIVETMNLLPLLERGMGEFTLVLKPLAIVGATGAPVRPLALLDQSGFA